MTNLGPNTFYLKKGQLRELVALIAPAPVGSSCKIRAHNDAEAVERWLDEYFDKATTHRSYKKEAERFLVWCVLVRKTIFGQLNRDDVDAYISFLQNPEPKEYWCGPKGGRRSSNTDKSWHPFTGPLGPSAIRTAIAILNSLMSYLVDARYVDFNPFVLMRRKTRFQDNIALTSLAVHERILSFKEWQMLLNALEAYPEDGKKARLKFLVIILFLLGLRIDELARATWSQFRKIHEKWWFLVKGKGDRLGKIPVNHELLHALITYRHHLGKTPIPTESDSSPIIASLSDPSSGLSARQMSNLIKELAHAAAHDCEDSLIKQKLRRFSPHWLRHLSASRQDLAGISFTNIRQNLRHQNDQTTRQYVHAYDDERHKEMEKLKFYGGLNEATPL